MQTKKKGLIAGIVLIVIALLILNHYFQFLPFALTFEYGWNPYGESSIQITDLQKDINSTIVGRYCNSRGECFQATVSDSISKYWDIKRISQTDKKYLAGHGLSDFSGNDFNLITTGGSQLRPDACDMIAGYIQLVTAHNFSDKHFKAEIRGMNGRPLNIFLSTPTEDISIYDYQFGLSPSEFIIQISPSPLTNDVKIFINGEFYKTVTFSEEYKIKFIFYPDMARLSSGQTKCGTSYEGRIVNPSFKQEFGCEKSPGEQYYLNIFNEGENVNLAKLDNFQKFCLDEMPMMVYSNVGSTTDAQTLVDLVNEMPFVVPQGQIWAVPYIGKMGTFETGCEASGIYNRETRDCMARTILTIQCPEGTLNPQTLECVIETIPAVYYFSDVKTHQDLQTGGMFRFTDILENYERKTPNSFNLFENQFSSNNIIYSEILPEIMSKSIYYKEENKDKWVVSFSYKGLPYNVHINDEVKLDDYLSVKVTNLVAYLNKKTKSIENFRIEYTFSLNPEFIDINYSKSNIIITNNYQPTDGGVVITKKDIVGKTTVESFEKYLSIGDTAFTADIKNLEELKVRSYIKIITPDYEYKIEATKAITIDLQQEIPGQPPIIKPVTEINWKLYIGVAVVLSIIGLLIYLKKEKKWR